MKALKGLVIGMGLLIVLGLGLLGYGMMRNASKASAQATPTSVSAPVSGASVAKESGKDTAKQGSYFSSEVSVAPGESLEQMTAIGDRLALRFNKGGEQRIVVIDPATGQIGGTIALVPQAAPKR